MADLEGVILSDYLLLQCISKGGVADVYRARQNGEGNYEVAVKIFRPGYAQRASFRDYFMGEAEKIGQFDHSNILPFLEFGEGEDLLYVVTPYVATGTLEDLLRRVGGKFSAMQALPIMQQLCSAVQYAHDHDVIHGNIKPTNIFVAADSRMLLADFGIARGYDDSQQSLTRVGWGSAEYTAPEQSLGVLRRSSDIYALGVLLFRILTGQPPFTGQTPVEVLLKHVRQPPPSARSLVPHISDAVDGVLRRAMQKRSDDRFASAEEFSNALLAAVTLAPVASPVAMPTPQAAPSQPSVVGNPQTPVPALSQSLSVGDPRTPVPPLVSNYKSSSYSPPAGPLVPHELSPSAPSVQQAPPTAGDGPRKNFLQENDDAGTFLFWSVDPAEWSPLANDSADAVPVSAGEYLRGMPMVPEVPPTPPERNVGVPQASRLAGTRGDKKAVQSRLKKVLPIAVVILLMLGLIGALLSSFLFPSDVPGTNTTRPIFTTTSTPDLGGVTATSTTHRATATPSARNTPTAAVAAQPTPNLTPLPTYPPVPAFSCTSGSITLDGSTNFQPAIEQLTTDYYSHCASDTANFTVNADESKAGLDYVASGNIDLAYSDLTSAARSGLVDYPVAALTYTVVVSADIQVTQLTTAQLQGIYTVQITNWSQVGGSNKPIVIISRPPGSTIRAIFEMYVLQGTGQSVAGTTLKSDSNEAAAGAVLHTTGAISYVSLASVASSGVQSVAINGVSASTEAVTSGAYPFWSIEHLYSDHTATGLELSFISFCSTTVGEIDLASYDAVPIQRISQSVLSTHTPGPTV